MTSVSGVTRGVPHAGLTRFCSHFLFEETWDLKNTKDLGPSQQVSASRTSAGAGWLVTRVRGEGAGSPCGWYICDAMQAGVHVYLLHASGGGGISLSDTPPS